MKNISVMKCKTQKIFKYCLKQEKKRKHLLTFNLVDEADGGLSKLKVFATPTNEMRGIAYTNAANEDMLNAQIQTVLHCLNTLTAVGIRIPDYELQRNLNADGE